MTKKEKGLEKFLNNPNSLWFSQIERIILSFGYVRIEAKWSHIKYKHTDIEGDLVIPVHNWDCKEYYKIKAKKNILLLLKK